MKRLFCIASLCLVLVGCQTATSPVSQQDPEGPSEPPAAVSDTASAIEPRYVISSSQEVIDCAADPTAIAVDEGIRVYFAAGGGEACLARGLDVPDSLVVDLDGEVVLDSDQRLPGDASGPHKRVFQLPDGRYRLYFQTPFGDSNPGIGSAISSDGINFELEPGLRLTAEQAGFESGYELSPGDVVPTLDGRYRMYFSSLTPLSGAWNEHTVRSAVSTDLLEWEVEEGDRIGGSAKISRSGEHPSAVAHPDGSVTLFYGSVVNFALYYSTSPDGVNFEREYRLVGTVLDSTFLLQADGSLIGFVGKHDPQTNISSIDKIVLNRADN